MISLNHQNILQLYNYHETENNLYFILEYCNQGYLVYDSETSQNSFIVKRESPTNGPQPYSMT